MDQRPTPYPPGNGTTSDLPLPPRLHEELRRALLTIRFGTIELVIHEGRVVQLERREKLRFEPGVTEPGR